MNLVSSPWYVLNYTTCLILSHLSNSVMMINIYAQQWWGGSYSVKRKVILFSWKFCLYIGFIWLCSEENKLQYTWTKHLECHLAKAAARMSYLHKRSKYSLVTMRDRCSSSTSCSAWLSSSSGDLQQHSSSFTLCTCFAHIHDCWISWQLFSPIE